MINVLEKLEPNDVFKYFEEITRIPRGSGNEKGISDYLVSFAKAHDLEFIQDSALNVIIKKPATKGYENSPAVILQGHMDMVCEKNRDVIHDFEKDPLKLVVEGNKLRASGTTLGSDNGIAVAMSLAILASKKIMHPAIEVLVTTDEESGMTGAIALKPEDVKGRMLLNLDSEEEGKLLVSCAGGLRDKIILPIIWKETKKGMSTIDIKVRGLKGGHSGMEINKGRANANIVLGRVLILLSTVLDFKLSALNGGAKNNAIPREADATIVIKSEDMKILKKSIKKSNEILQNEFRTSDANIKIQTEELEKNATRTFSADTSAKAVKLLYLIPNGIKTMSMDIDGLVESSTNLGVVTTTEKELTFDSAVRSSISSLKDEIVMQSKLIAEAIGASLITTADYPEWQYNPDSKLRDICKKVYKDMNGKEAEIIAIHAGVECGLFKKKFGEIDMISFGPNLYDVHTPDEHLSISSVKNVWEYLIEVLKEIK